MANRLAQGLRERSDEQLRGDLQSAHEELFTLRFQASTRQLADVSKIRKTRRQIARLRTLMSERGHVLAGSMPAGAVPTDEPAAEPPAVDEE